MVENTRPAGLRPRTSRATSRAGRRAVQALCCVLAAGVGATPVRDSRELAPGVSRFLPNEEVGFEVLWIGMYDVTGIRRVEDTRAPAASRGVVLGGAAPMRTAGSGSTITAATGVNFGVAFHFRAARPDESVGYRAVWRFPGAGITNPANGKSYTEYQSAESTCQGGVCVYGWSFSEPWEQVTGTWILELWRGTRKLHQQLFEVVAPGPATPVAPVQPVLSDR